MSVKDYTADQLKAIIKKWASDNDKAVKLSSFKKKYDMWKFLGENSVVLPNPATVDKKIKAAGNILSKYSTKPYDENEQGEFMNTFLEDELPLNPKGEYFNVKEQKYEKVALNKHQKDFIERFVTSNVRGAVLFHGVGTGKTLTAVVASHYYLKLYPEHKVVVITPSALLLNFVEGMRQFGLDIRDNRYKFFTYEKYVRAKASCMNALVIVDEAHNFRSKMVYEEVKDDEGKDIITVTSNKRGVYTKLFCTDKASKVLLLSATPFINQLYDIENLISMIDQKTPLDMQDFYKICNDNEMRRDYFRCRISHYEKEQTSIFFPERRDIVAGIVMDEKTLQKYNDIESAATDKEGYAYTLFGQNRKKSKNDDDEDSTKDISSFYNGVRRASNMIDFENSKKIEYIMKIINSDKDSKNIVYSSFLNAGIKLLMKRLDEKGIPYAVISGAGDSKQKELAKERYNNWKNPNYPDDKKVRILLITRAGAEGVDTIQTRNIFLMEGVWNEALAEQIIARAIRFKSHFALPKKDQYVNVHRLILAKPTDVPLIDKINSGQFKDWNFLVKKWKEAKKEEKDAAKKQTKELLDDIPEFDREKYKKMTKTEKQQYVAKLKFGKTQTSVETMSILKDIPSPSIDLYLLVLSKAKQKIIDEFIKQLDRTDQIETCITSTSVKIREVIEAKQKKLGRELNDKEVFKIRKEMLSDQKSEAVKKVEQTESKLSKTLERVKELYAKKKQTQKIRALQQYFTPEKLVKKMIEYSSLNTLFDHLEILEPTAGYGNIVKVLLESGKDIHVDMVEKDKENRDVLSELVTSAPDVVSLMSTPDFLMFIPNKQYDMIFMNPPFHLKKSLNPEYKQDYYDIDFVKRAYGMLKDGGELIALVHTDNMNKKEYNDWLRQHDYKYVNIATKWEGEKQGKLSEIERLKVSLLKLVKTEDDNDNKLLKIPEMNNSMTENAREIMQAEALTSKPIVEEERAEPKRRGKKPYKY